MFRYAQHDKYADRAVKYSPSCAKREYGEAGREFSLQNKENRVQSGWV